MQVSVDPTRKYLLPVQTVQPPRVDPCADRELEVEGGVAGRGQDRQEEQAADVEQATEQGLDRGQGVR